MRSFSNLKTIPSQDEKFEEKLPVSALKKEAIVEAKEILTQISTSVKELAQLRKIGLRADYDDTMRVMSKLSDLSSKYF